MAPFACPRTIHVSVMVLSVSFQCRFSWATHGACNEGASRSRSHPGRFALPASSPLPGTLFVMHFSLDRLVCRAHRPRVIRIISMGTSAAATDPKTVARSHDLLSAMERFATEPWCRRSALLKYFGEDMGERRPIIPCQYLSRCSGPCQYPATDCNTARCLG